MMDHCDEESSGSIDGSSKSPKSVLPDGTQFQELKCCSDCRTTKTPLWRGGPSGPKSLCNACGIRYRKKRRALMGLKEGSEEEDKVEKKSKKGKGNGSIRGVSRLLGLGRNVLLNRSSELQRRQRRRLREEEEAAVLLMALSSGLIYA